MAVEKNHLLKSAFGDLTKRPCYSSFSNSVSGYCTGGRKLKVNCPESWIIPGCEIDINVVQTSKYNGDENGSFEVFFLLSFASGTDTALRFRRRDDI
jgi:hypothetical protein